MTVYSGKYGSLRTGTGATNVSRVRNWNLSSTVDNLEVTNLGQDARDYVPGLKSATGSAQIVYHDDDSTLQNILDNCILTGAPSNVRLELRWGSKKINFDATITGANITCAAGEVMTADINFQMDGDYRTVTL